MQGQDACITQSMTINMAKDLHSSYPERRYFERGANLLRECLENDCIRFSASGANQTADSIMRVRVLPNGRLNLDTVDELVRSSFHMLASDVFNQLHERKE